MTKTIEPDKYPCFGYSNGFGGCGTFLLSVGSGFHKKVITFKVDASSSVHGKTRKKEVLILGNSLT